MTLLLFYGLFLCYDRAPHPPLDQGRVFCQARCRAPPQGPAVAPVIAVLPPPLPNLNLLHHLPRLAPAPALYFLFPIARVLSHQ
jgi:hypothetical protein